MPLLGGWYPSPEFHCLLQFENTKEKVPVAKRCLCCLVFLWALGTVSASVKLSFASSSGQRVPGSLASAGGHNNLTWSPWVLKGRFYMKQAFLSLFFGLTISLQASTIGPNPCQRHEDCRRG